MAVEDAVDYMLQMRYSQLPVTVWRDVIGVFSFRSFSQTIVENAGELVSDGSISEMSVEEFVEQLRFVNDDENWESILPYIDKDDSVLVGNRTNTTGIVTAMDVVNFLHQIAKPFVIIGEIELSIRRIIENCVNDTELTECIRNSLSRKYETEELPTSVEEMTFNDYVQVIGDGRNWGYFEGFFGGKKGSMRKPTIRILEKIGGLRNDVFHFKRKLDEEDDRFLNLKRDWLQRKARIYEGERLQAEVEVPIIDDDIRESAEVVLASGRYQIKRMRNNSIQVIDLSSDKHVTPVKPLLRKAIIEKSLAVDQYLRTGREKNTRSLGRDVIRALKPI